MYADKDTGREFGEEIRRRRIALGWSLRKGAREAQISPTYLSHVEIGHVPPPSAEIVERMAIKLQLNRCELLELAGRWGESLASQVNRDPARRKIVQRVLAMEEADLDSILEQLDEILDRKAGES